MADAQDMSRILDQLDAVEAAVPHLSGRLDAGRVAVAGDKDDSAFLTTAGPDWHADPFHLAPGPRALLTLFGAEHCLGGISGYDVAETTDEDPGRVATIARSVRLTWTGSPGARQYRIYQDGVARATTASAEPQVVLTGLAPGSSHTFAVSAVNTAGESAISGSVTANILPAQDTPPSAPRSVVAKDGTLDALIRDTDNDGRMDR